MIDTISHRDGLDFEVTTDAGRYCWSAYWRDELVGRGFARTRFGLGVGMRFAVRRWRRASRKAAS